MKDLPEISRDNKAFSGSISQRNMEQHDIDEVNRSHIVVEAPQSSSVTRKLNDQRGKDVKTISSSGRVNNWHEDSVQCIHCLRRIKKDDVKNHNSTCELRTESCRSVFISGQ
jgi:hypothetical protein